MIYEVPGPVPLFVVSTVVIHCSLYIIPLQQNLTQFLALSPAPFPLHRIHEFDRVCWGQPWQAIDILKWQAFQQLPASEKGTIRYTVLLVPGKALRLKLCRNVHIIRQWSSKSFMLGELSGLAGVNYNDIGQQMNRSTLNLNWCQFCTNKGTDKRMILCEMQSTRNVWGGWGMGTKTARAGEKKIHAKNIP